MEWGFGLLENRVRGCGCARWNQRFLVANCTHIPPKQSLFSLFRGGNSIEGSTPSRHSQVENQKENPKRNFMRMNKPTKTTPMISSHMLQKTSNEHGTAKRQEQNVLTLLTRTQVDILVNTVLKSHPKEVHQYRSLETKELIVFCLAGIATGICKCRAEPNILDSVLCEKLDGITLDTFGMLQFISIVLVQHL
ncbi:hypothetical protein Cgig2_019783 [Carnegiea gigantea]|uniref:Uncharacterized protein n=1 Tax=Carnegiea gigantea TaxID=171969 RepID=A0A9Q1KDT0_9CARY|nr:hypothetical protein Cgig2_019783 [Carnegiea gigantea]